MCNIRNSLAIFNWLKTFTLQWKVHCMIEDNCFKDDIPFYQRGISLMMARGRKLIIANSRLKVAPMKSRANIISAYILMLAYVLMSLYKRWTSITVLLKYETHEPKRNKQRNQVINFCVNIEVSFDVSTTSFFNRKAIIRRVAWNRYDQN